MKGEGRGHQRRRCSSFRPAPAGARVRLASWRGLGSGRGPAGPRALGAIPVDLSHGGHPAPRARGKELRGHPSTGQGSIRPAQAITSLLW